MKRNMLKYTTSRSVIRQLFLMASIIVLLIASGCTTNRYNGQRNWNRSPASTGHNRCGCLLNPATERAVKLYQQHTYALQA